MMKIALFVTLGLVALALAQAGPAPSTTKDVSIKPANQLARVCECVWDNWVGFDTLLKVCLYEAHKRPPFILTFPVCFAGYTGANLLYIFVKCTRD